MFSSFFETSTFGHPAQNDQRPSEPLKSGVGNGVGRVLGMGTCDERVPV